MKLINIQIFPKGSNGWGSDLLIFGEHITQLFGPNGCGKTPLIQSIAYCLGYPCIFRQDIYDHCESVRLRVQTDRGDLLISRLYHKTDFEVNVIDPLGASKKFFNEADYSSYIFDWLGLETTNLVSNSRTKTSPYLSTILPFFYINQDKGYSKIYSAEKNFIKDQFSEMIRLLFSLPVKNSFDEKKEKIIAQENLELLDKQVEEYNRKFENAKLIIDTTIKRSAEEIRNEIENLENEIEYLKSQGSHKEEALQAIDKIISVNMLSISKINQEVNEKNSRICGIESIINEINAEIETLTLNESARRVFLSIEEICSSRTCQLFSASSDSYVKNLLYLKDQIKDLDRNKDLDLSNIEKLKSKKNIFEKNIEDLIVKRKEVMEKSEINSILEAISELKNTIFNLNDQLNDIEKIDYLQENLLKLKYKRNKVFESYTSLNRSEKSIIPSVLKIKSELRELLIKWLGVLRTKNISFDISFYNDFMPTLGSENINNLTGSTLIRAVLAFHASIMELLFKNNKGSFGFLIFDTPKQHEIHNTDLDNYIQELKRLCEEYSIQVIFSTTEYHYIGDNKDSEWIPVHRGKEQNMFLYMLD